MMSRKNFDFMILIILCVRDEMLIKYDNKDATQKIPSVRWDVVRMF